MDYSETIIKELVKSRLKNRRDLESFKRKIAKKYKTTCPSNIGLLQSYHKLIKKENLTLKNLFITRPIRSLSGIVNVSVLTKPYPCPGKCIYCPVEKGIPKSYVSGEPAVERAKKLNYNPYLQVKKRLEMLEMEGHPTDKVELRIVGGTWSYYPKKYQEWFVKRCFEACNESASLKIFNFQFSIFNEFSIFNFQTLKKEQKKNEKAKHRMIGISIETRPDFIDISEIKSLRKLGVTMVELGVQSVYDDVLKLNLRGHGIKETILATKLLKDAGFKVLYQMMPNLLGSDLKRDEKIFEELFKNPGFRPDLLKIYPCALLKETPLYKLYLKGKYEPYTESQIINFLKGIKKKIPYYVRIQRITRDIPSPRIIKGGVKISNLRQIIAKESKNEGWRCKCIRCREVRGEYKPAELVHLFRQDYQASNGREIFLSFENKTKDKLYSLLRLRVQKENELCSILSVLKNTALIRELHTYGKQIPLRGKSIFSPQHKGLGKKLIKEAEKIAKNEFGFKKIAVISAIGTREYFRKLGYKLKDTYMVKTLF